MPGTVLSGDQSDKGDSHGPAPLELTVEKGLCGFPTRMLCYSLIIRDRGAQGEVLGLAHNRLPISY